MMLLKKKPFPLSAYNLQPPCGGKAKNLQPRTGRNHFVGCKAKALQPTRGLKGRRHLGPKAWFYYVKLRCLTKIFVENSTLKGCKASLYLLSALSAFGLVPRHEVPTGLKGETTLWFTTRGRRHLGCLTLTGPCDVGTSVAFASKWNRRYFRVSSTKIFYENSTLKGNKLTISYHWREVYYRLFYLISSVIVTFSVSIYFSSQLVYLFVRPFLEFNREFIFTDLTEAFSITLSICLQMTLALALPLLLYQFCCFFLPSCYLSERKRVVISIIWYNVFLLSSLFVIYYFFLPAFCHFLVNFSINSTSFTILLQARIGSYIALFSRVFLTSILLFQLFILTYFSLSFLAKEQHDSFQKICRKRPQIFLVLVTLAALISPPDPWSQLIVASTFSLLFEITIWLACLNVEVLVGRRYFRL